MKYTVHKYCNNNIHFVRIFHQQVKNAHEFSDAELDYSADGISCYIFYMGMAVPQCGCAYASVN